MILGFLAVKGEGGFLPGFAGQSDGRGAGQRDALVGGAIEDIGLDVLCQHRFGVEMSQPVQFGACVEQAGVEEVGATTARFECEIAKAQHIAFDGVADELLLIVLHFDLLWQ